jgi:hypothetical protein
MRIDYYRAARRLEIRNQLADARKRRGNMAFAIICPIVNLVLKLCLPKPDFIGEKLGDTRVKILYEVAFKGIIF